MTNKDWTGNSNSIYKTLGASNHTDAERQKHDYYATDPKATELLLELESFSNKIWEPSCGGGHMSKVLEKAGYNVISTDLIDRGYGKGSVDFLATKEKDLDLDIVTNPPYAMAKSFVEKALETVAYGHKVAMFLKLTFLESAERRELFKQYPAKKIWVASSRLLCSKNGDFYQRDKDGNIKYDTNGNPKKLSSAACYAWFIWEKGYHGPMIIDLFN